MSSSLDMSLDDIIKSNRNSDSVAAKFRGRGRRNAGTGPFRRLPHRAVVRPAPYSKPVRVPDSMWNHGMFPGQASGGVQSTETGTKLYISNLDYGVSNEDIKELFSDVGELKRYGIHYDKSGRSKGTAEVVFSRKEEALEAIKRYHNVQLDGKPMQIEIVGTNILSLTALHPAASNGMFRNQNFAFNRGRGRGDTRGRPRGGVRGPGRGRGRGRGRGEKVSAEDLDADLEKYHKEAMHTD